MEIGNFNELKVNRKVDFGLYLQSDKGEILIPNKYVPEGTEIGDTLKVFVYTDSEDRLIATTLIPKAVVGDFASLEVKQVNQFGAFLDWGLEKDLFVPFNEQYKRLKEGQKCIVRVCLDYQTNRVIGVTKINAFLKKELKGLKEGDAVDLFIYDETDLGFSALVNKKYSGILYRSEVFENLQVGDEKKGFIKKLREDGKIDLSLKASGLKAIKDDKDKILNALERNKGFIPLNDESDPEKIKMILQMSKKAFKRAVGGLLKSDMVSIEPDGIRLKAGE